MKAEHANLICFKRLLIIKRHITGVPNQVSLVLEKKKEYF